jgi:hypothetical protein
LSIAKKTIAITKNKFVKEYELLNMVFSSGFTFRIKVEIPHIASHRNHENILNEINKQYILYSVFANFKYRNLYV